MLTKLEYLGIRGCLLSKSQLLNNTLSQILPSVNLLRGNLTSKCVVKYGRSDEALIEVDLND